MNNESWAVLAAGVVTSIATAFIVTLISNMTGFNLFSFSIWVILPAGAGFCGFAAASGYYFAAKYLHIMPSKSLLFQMVLVAAFTQLGIYYLEYLTLDIDGQKVSSIVSFETYLDVLLTKTHMRIGRGLQHDTGEVGSFGYWLAAIHFVGFMIGDLALYFQLADQSNCADCKKYLNSIITKKDSFDDFDSFAAYYDGEFSNPVDSQEFAEHVGVDHTGSKAEKGSLRLETQLLNCPQCGDQTVSQKVFVSNGKDWKDVNDLKRIVAIPKGLDVTPAYRAHAC